MSALPGNCTRFAAVLPQQLSFENLTPMELAAAKATLKSLLEGVDPVTGYGDSQIHGAAPRAGDPRAAVRAGGTGGRGGPVAASGAPAQKHRAALGSADDAQVLAAFRSGEPLLQIAADHQRSLASVESRLERLGALAPEQRLTRNRYVTPPRGTAAAR